MPGAWPAPDATARGRTGAALLAAVPDGALVLVDGLIGSRRAARGAVPEADRLRLVRARAPAARASIARLAPTSREGERAALAPPPRS